MYFGFRISSAIKIKPAALVFFSFFGNKAKFHNSNQSTKFRFVESVVEFCVFCFVLFLIKKTLYLFNEMTDF